MTAMIDVILALLMVFSLQLRLRVMQKNRLKNTWHERGAYPHFIGYPHPLHWTILPYCLKIMIPDKRFVVV
jgi:hypothetical protein